VEQRSADGYLKILSLAKQEAQWLDSRLAGGMRLQSSWLPQPIAIHRTYYVRCEFPGRTLGAFSIVVDTHTNRNASRI